MSFLVGFSALLRKRYDSLSAAASLQKRRFEEASRRREEFEHCLATVLPRLQEMEERVEGVAESRDKIQERLETLGVRG